MRQSLVGALLLVFCLKFSTQELDQCGNNCVNSECELHSDEWESIWKCGECKEGWRRNSILAKGEVEPTWGTDCLEDIDECNENSSWPIGMDQMCDHSYCSNLPGTGSYVCGPCEEGWFGLDNKTGCIADEDYCKQSGMRCQLSNKECIYLKDGYECGNCLPGYAYIDEGKYTQKSGIRRGGYTYQEEDKCHEMDECNATFFKPEVNKCEHSNCTNTVGSYHCGPCHAGWYGLVEKTGCHAAFDYCSFPNVSCKHSECFNVEGGHVCGECQDGWDRTDDQIGCPNDIDECWVANPCKQADCTNHDPPIKYTCDAPCKEGWQDLDEKKGCLKDIDECEEGRCVNSNCTNTQGSYWCHGPCDPGWTGLNSRTGCPVDIDECASNPCMWKSTCHNLINHWKCDCAPGWSGTDCKTESLECLSVPCKNNGYCVEQENQYWCYCREGWNGTHCEKKVAPQVFKVKKAGAAAPILSFMLVKIFSFVAVAVFMRHGF